METKIRSILIVLTDVIGYNHSEAHVEAFDKALRQLTELFEKENAKLQNEIDSIYKDLADRYVE